MSYYTLVTRDCAGAKWGPQFGDHDKETVIEEMQECYWGNYSKSNCRILKTTTMHQREVDAAIAKLNCETVTAITSNGHGLSWRTA